MTDINNLKEIEVEIKKRLGDLVNKCGIMIVIFTESNDQNKPNVWTFGNIEDEERIQLMTSIVVTHRLEQAQAMADILKHDTVVN